VLEFLHLIIKTMLPKLQAVKELRAQVGDEHAVCAEAIQEVRNRLQPFPALYPFTLIQ